LRPCWPSTRDPTPTRARRASRSSGATTCWRRAGAVARAGRDPRHAGALALRAAALASEDGRAAAEVAALRRTNPREPAAESLAAAAALLVDDHAAYDAQRDGHRRRPRRRRAFSVRGRGLTRQRRYAEARAIARREWPPTGATRLPLVLGTTLLRLGDEAQAGALRLAWQRDPYDARTFNLLNLFRKIIRSLRDRHDGAPCRFRVEPAARPALEAIVAPFPRETYARSWRLRFEPRGP